MKESGSSPSERFRRAIAGLLGLSFDDTQQQRLLELLQSRSEATALSLDRYLTMLESGGVPPRERRELARNLTVGETYFFRNSEQFDALRDEVLPARAREAMHRPLKFLSAACATGEEPYSIAILLQELREHFAIPVQITGLDLNAAFLEKAREGRYSRWSLRGVADERVARWFRESGNREHCLDDNIRRMVTFEEHNLLEDHPEWLGTERYDVIFCRNFIMYLTPEAMSQVVDRLTRSLLPGGYLFLGHAETLRGLTRNVHLHHTHGAFYYQRRHGAAETEVSPVAAVVAPLLAAEVEDAASWVAAIGRASERVRRLVDGMPAEAGNATAHVALLPRHDLSDVVELLRTERYDDALCLVDALPRHVSHDPDVLTVRAVLLTHRGELGEAERVCGELLQLDELNAGAHYLMALCREAAADPGSAIDHDQAAIYLDPSFAAPRLHLALLDKKTGRHFEARNHLARALVLLEREDPSRLLFFGGGFGREALIAFCRAELIACGGAPR